MAAILVLWLLLVGVPGVLSARLGARVWSQRATTSTTVKVTAALSVAGAAIGTVGMLVGGVEAFAAFDAQQRDPSVKARALAEGISAAMNCTALGLAVWTPAMVAAVVLTRKRPYSPS